VAWSEAARQESIRVRRLKALLRARRFSIHAVSPEEFIGFRSRSEYAGFLTEHTPEWYREHNVQLFKVRGVDAGYGLYRDEENGGKLTLISVHNNSTIPGIGDRIVREAVARGAVALDCYKGYLSQKFYPRYGFHAVRSIPWDDAYAPDDWNYKRDKRPRVVWMER
jgi:hypothetical protein